MESNENGVEKNKENNPLYNFFGNYFSKIVYENSHEVKNTLSGDIYLYTIKSFTENYNNKISSNIRKINEIEVSKKRYLSSEEYLKSYKNSRGVEFDGFVRDHNGIKIENEISEFRENKYNELIFKYFSDKKEISDFKYFINNVDDIEIENKDEFLNDYQKTLKDIADFVNDIIANNIDSIKWKKESGIGFLGLFSSYFATMRDVIPNEDAKEQEERERNYKKNKKRQDEYVNIELESLRKKDEIKNKFLKKVSLLKKEASNIVNDDELFSKKIIKMHKKIENFIFENNEFNREIFNKFFDFIGFSENKKRNIFDFFDIIESLEDDTIKDLKKQSLIKLLDMYVKSEIEDVKKDEEKNKKEIKSKMIEERRKMVDEMNKKLSKIEAEKEWEKAKILRNVEIDNIKLEVMRQRRLYGERIENFNENVPNLDWYI